MLHLVTGFWQSAPEGVINPLPPVPGPLDPEYPHLHSVVTPIEIMIIFSSEISRSILGVVIEGGQDLTDAFVIPQDDCFAHLVPPNKKASLHLLQEAFGALLINLSRSDGGDIGVRF